MHKRKLKDVAVELEKLKKPGKAEGFFKNLKIVDKLNGLIEDIRDAVMDYQVCIRVSDACRCD